MWYLSYITPGGSCGTCSCGTSPCRCEAGTCVDLTGCIPNCPANNACGPDGCGGVCGSCPLDKFRCTGTGTCERTCNETGCGGRQCGVDPLCSSRTCGACLPGQLCVSGTCCSNPCNGRECGADPGCGVSCGSCPYAGQTCTAAGQCEFIVTPPPTSDTTTPLAPTPTPDPCSRGYLECPCTYGETPF